MIVCKKSLLIASAYLCCLVTPVFGDGQSFHSDQYGYTIALPDGWVRVPKEVFQERLGKVASIQGESRFISEVAFQDKQTPWFDADYFVVKIFLTGAQLSDETIRKTVKEMTNIDPEVVESRMGLFNAGVDVKPGTVKLDPTTKSYLWNMESLIGGERWNMTTFGFFGRSSLVHLSFYGKPSPKLAKVENLVSTSFKFDAAFAYQASAPATPSESHLKISTPQKPTISDAFGARGRPISSVDADILAKFLRLPDRWNRAAAPLVRDYLDPNVPAERWVKDAAPWVGELRAVQVEMHMLALSIENEGIRETFKQIAKNYRDKLDSVTALHMAVAKGDNNAELEARQGLLQATAKGQDLAESLIDRIRPFVDPQVLQQEMEKRGAEIGELMKPKERP